MELVPDVKLSNEGHGVKITLHFYEFRAKNEKKYISQNPMNCMQLVTFHRHWEFQF